MWFKRWSLVIYVLCSLVLVSLNYMTTKVGHPIPKLLFTYNNPIVIISSVAFLLAFERINLSSKLINHFAKSTLAILLGHTAIFFLFTKQFKYIFNHFIGLQLVGYWVMVIAIVFCASIAIDQIRLLLYIPIEKLMKRKIKNNEIIPTEN